MFKLCLFFFTVLIVSFAQNVEWTLETAVRAALVRYPAVRIVEADVKKAGAGIELARGAYLPKLDAVAGVNRATRNNVLGSLLPSQVIAPISGPVLNTNSGASAWGSTVGLLMSWEPYDFGVRRATVSIAEAGRERAQASVTRTQLEVAAWAADTYLTVIAAAQTVRAAEAAVQRSAELFRITDALVKAELRPGLESSLAHAEQASAQAQLIRARQAKAEAEANLGTLVGADLTRGISSGKLLDMPGRLIAEVESNPYTREQGAVVAESEARLRSLDKALYPHFNAQAATYARGTGALGDGRLLGGVNGLGPTIQNWAVGFTATFSVFDYAAVRAKRGAETAQIEADRARLEKLKIDLKAQRDRALASYEGARQIAGTTPALIAAARQAVDQTTARYQAGLGTALEVAEAQRRLAQAEIDDGLAHLSIWRARLAVYAAQGDITPLLAEAR